MNQLWSNPFLNLLSVVPFPLSSPSPCPSPRALREVLLLLHCCQQTKTTMAIFFTRDNLVLAFPLLAVCSTYVRKLLLVICGLSHWMVEPACMYHESECMMSWHQPAMHCYTHYLCTAALKLTFSSFFSYKGIFQVCSAAIWSTICWICISHSQGEEQNH